MTYRSKIDLWLVVVIAGSVLLPLLFLVNSIMTTPAAESAAGLFVGLIILAITYVGMYFSMWPCEYTLKEHGLHIRCGLIRKDIPYRDIKSAVKSGNLLSAPALSLKRIRIDYNNGYALISPKNREEFIQVLMEKVAESKSLKDSMA